MKNARVYTGMVAQLPSANDVGWVQRIVMHLQRVLRVRPAADRVLKHVETLPIGPRKSIHLIECDGQRFLVSDGLGSPVPLSWGGAAPNGSEVER